MPRLQSITVAGPVAHVAVADHTVVLDAADLPIIAGRTLCVFRTKSTTYVQASNRGRTESDRLARLLLQPLAGQLVDHINGDPFDNRRENLRLVTPQQNSRNRAKSGRSCSSRYKGVSLCRGSWRAVIYRNYRQIRLGLFNSEQEAAEAYDSAAREMFGECAALNFPKVGEQSAHRPISRTIHANASAQKGQRNNV